MYSRSVHYHRNDSIMNKTHPESGVTDNLPLGFKVPLAIIMTVIIICCFGGNSVVCFIVYRKPTMRSAINLLLANMAASDILLSLLCMPFSLAALVRGAWMFSNAVCKVVAFLHVYLVCTGMCILLAISIDRYMIIVRRKDKLNPTRAKMLIVFSWCFSLIFALPPSLGWSSYHYYPSHPQCILEIPRGATDKAYITILMTLVFFLPIFTMAYSYICILKTVRKNRLRIRSNPSTISVSQVSKLGLAGMNVAAKPNVDMSFKTRTFKTILILYLVFLFSWTPYSLATLTLNLSRTVNPFMTSVVLWIGYLNSALNPAIYAWRIKKFREACIDLLPTSFKLIPKLGIGSKRRVNPSAVYQCNNGVEQSTV